jgi:hypothetical protein
MGRVDGSALRPVSHSDIRFTIADPHYLRRAIQGPLEDLYPDVEI